MAQFNPDDFSRFADFTIFTSTYKTVSDHPITVDILVPSQLIKSPSTSIPRPIIFRIHGGGLIIGSSLFPDFFAPWLLQLAARESAVIISPNHRLLPEATVGDALADIEDAWNWTHTKLPAFLEAETNGAVKADVKRIMAAGDSAGGYLSLMLGLSHPDEIRSVAASYPMVDLKDRHYTEDYKKSMWGLPQVPRSVYDEHLEKLRKGEIPNIVSADPRLERAPLFFSIFQRGVLRNFFPPEKREWFPLDRLDDGARFPRGGVLIWHGKSDSVVPVEGSLKLERKVKEVDPELNFRLVLQDGDHAFDATSSIDDKWMADGLKDVVAAWLD